MPDHRDDIPPLDELQIYMDGELIFDGADPDSYLVLDVDPDVAAAQLAELADPTHRAAPGSPEYERARRNPRVRAIVDRLAAELLGEGSDA